MSEAKHTPGPWVIERPIHHEGMVKIDGPSLTCRGFKIATDVDAQRAACIEADARLIAASPCLLEALEQLVIEYDDVELADAEPSSLTAAFNAARAAIAKAKVEA